METKSDFFAVIFKDNSKDIMLALKLGKEIATRFEKNGGKYLRFILFYYNKVSHGKKDVIFVFFLIGAIVVAHWRCEP